MGQIAIVDPLRFYTQLITTLEQISEGSALGELFTKLRMTGETRGLPLHEDEAIQRMLLRLGVLSNDLTQTESYARIEAFLRDLVTATNRSEAQVSLVLRLYAAGMEGVVKKAICGDIPHCRECGITKDCEFYNAPPGWKEARLPPAKRLIREGVESLSDEEVVALLLAGNRAGEEAITTARNLLSRFGGFRALAAATYGELASLRDLGPAEALRLAVCGAFYRRALAEQRTPGPVIRSPRDIYEFCYPRMRDLKKEEFVVLLLDQKNRILREEKISVGTLTESLVHPREVFGPAIRESAAALVFVHNHPSGDSTPSQADRDLTRRLCDAAHLMQFRVLDHIIIGDGNFTSFSEQGWL